MQYNKQIGEKTEGFEKEKPNIKRTMFNRSRMKHQQGDIGTLDVLDCFEALPNEEGKLNYTVRLKARNPTVRPIKTPIKVRVDAWLVNKGDCWEGFRDHISGGSLGTSKPSCPLLYYGITNNTSASSPTASSTSHRAHALTPNSLANQLGVPVPQYTKKLHTNSESVYGIGNNRYCDLGLSPVADTNSSYPVTIDSEYRRVNGVTLPIESLSLTESSTNKLLRINALPFVAYQKIARRYQNYNILYKNANLYPKVENHFKLPYTVSSSGYVNVLSYDNPLRETGTRTSIMFNDIATTHSANYNNETNYALSGPMYGLNTIWLWQKRCVNLNGDVFTTASPFAHLIRNNATQPSVYDGLLMAEILNLSPTQRDTLLTEYGGSTLMNRISYQNNVDGNTNESASDMYGTYNGDSGYGFTLADGTNSSDIDYAEKNMLSLVNANMESLRNMAVLTRLKEKIGKINQVDFYNGFIESTFGVNPRTEIGEPIYIGGETFDLLSGEKLTTNTTIANSNNYGEMGTLEGTFNANLGSYGTKDHAYVIVTMNIVPDNAYSGTEKMFTKILTEEEYLPDYNALEPMAIKRGELGSVYSGGTYYDTDIIGYADRYYDFKSRQTKIVGLGENTQAIGTTLSSSVFLSSYDHCQFITRKTAINLSEMGLSANKILWNDDALTVTDEPMFDVDVLCGVKSLMPLPYKSREMQNII